MAALKIQEIGDDDVDDVIALWQRCGLTRPWNDAGADIEFARKCENAAVLGGWLKGRLAASAMVGHDGHRGSVYYVSVDPDMQNKGLGHEIMAAAEDWLRTRGVWKLNLMVRADNAPVINFYSALGYDSEDRVNLAKWIDASKKPSEQKP